MLSTKRKFGVCPKVTSVPIKCSNEIRAVHTLPGGGFLYVDNCNKVGLVNTAYGWHRQEVAGHALGYSGRVDGKCLQASFNGPMGIIQDANGDIVILDSDNKALRKIKPGGDVSTFAGRGSPGWNQATQDEDTFDNPEGIAVSQEGLILVADTNNHCLRWVFSDGKIKVLCGGPHAGFKDGPRHQVLFDRPSGILVLPNGNWLVSDSGNNKLREVFPDGTTKTWAGGEQGFKDGPRLQAQFDNPRGMAMTWDGIIVVADRNNNRVRQIDGQQVSTLAGTGEYSYGMHLSCDAALASFRGPINVAVDHEGCILVCEDSPRNDQIRVISDTGYAPAAHHREHHMKQIVQNTAMAVVQTVTDKCAFHVRQDFARTCETALLAVNVSAAHREAGLSLKMDDDFCGLVYLFVTMLPSEREFKLHAALMANASHYFKISLKDTFNSAWNLKKDGKFYMRLNSEMCNVKYIEEALVMVIDFIYSGKATVSEEETMEMTDWSGADGSIPFLNLECDILTAADFFGMEWMVSVYTTIFHLRLTPTTVLEKLFLVSKIPGLKSARSAAMDYLVENVADVKEQDPKGWDNLKRFKRPILIEIIDALITSKEKKRTYKKALGTAYGVEVRKPVRVLLSDPFPFAVHLMPAADGLGAFEAHNSDPPGTPVDIPSSPIIFGIENSQAP